MKILLDTGPWVALHCARDAHHAWAKAQFNQFDPPFYTCEAVVTETCFLLAREGFDPARALSLVEKGVIVVDFALSANIASVRELFQRYNNAPASLADACLIRMSEIVDSSKVLTLDADFKIYRRLGGRKVVPTISPAARS
jgi:uncharacterized protein